MDGDCHNGTITKYFRIRNFGFIQLNDPAMHEQYKDIFFHLDHIPATISVEKLIRGQAVVVRLKQANRGWVADYLEIV